MSKRLDNSTKAKILFVLLSVVLILITWYKLKVQGITMTEEPEEPTYQALLICNNTDENHVHTDECYEQVEVEANEVQEQEIPENIVEPVQEEENTIVTTENIIEEEEISEENSVNEIIPEEDTIEEFTKELKYEDDELVVIATAEDEKTIPNKASINVCKINKDDEKYAKVEQSLKEKGEEENTTIEGFIAYDITLRDEAFNEIEPNGKVNISLNYKNALIPEGIENQDLEINVHHFEEDSQGNVVEIVNLSENNQLQKIETDDQQKLEKVEFETESFSTFTISYSNNKVKVNVHYVDESGNELNANQRDLTGNATMTLADYKDKITASGYIYIDAHYSSYNGKVITKIQGISGKTSTSINTNNVTYTVKFLNGDTDVGMIEFESKERSVDVYLVYASTASINISDTIVSNGCINAVSIVNGTPTIVPATEGITYKWYKSTTNGNYQEIERVKISGDDYNITEKNGPSINVALDEGATMWYKVEKYLNGDYQSEAVYHIPYYKQVQNGSFENPAHADSTDTETSGNDTFVWKTTATDGVIEVARTYGVDSNGNILKNGISTDVLKKNLKAYHFAYVPDGNQAAEINANSDGALYQDLLSIPGSQLYWSLYHRARGVGFETDFSRSNGDAYYTANEKDYEDEMYVVAMSTLAAEKYDVTTQAKVLEVKRIAAEAAAKVKNGTPLEQLSEKERDLYDAEIVTISTKNNGNGTMTFSNGTSKTVSPITFGTSGTVTDRVSSGWYYSNVTSNYSPSNWHYYTGNFSIPSKQYLTRYFFVSGNTQYDKDNPNDTQYRHTIGNLLDNIKVSDELPRPNPDQAQIVLQKKIEGLDEVPLNYSVPLEVSYKLYEDGDTDVDPTKREQETEELRLKEDTNGNAYRYYRHSYPITIDVGGKLELYSALEKPSSNQYNYEVEGYTIAKKIKVTVGDYASQTGDGIYEGPTLLYEGNAGEFEQEDLSRYNIEPQEFVFITFTNTYTKKPKASVTVNKVDKQNNPLYNSAFSLVGNGNEIKYIDALTSTEYTADENEDGKITFTDLEYSTNAENPEFVYTLTEILAPDGYYKFEVPIQFCVTEENGVELLNQSEISNYVTLSNGEIYVINTPCITLPKAGGIGANINYIVGCLIMLFAIITYKKIKYVNK